jgi:hypothetical protein
MRNTLRFMTRCSFLLMTFLFVGCQKEEELALADVQLTDRDPETFTYSLNPATVGDSIEIEFDAANGADCGQIHIQWSLDGEDWIEETPVTPDSGIGTILLIAEEPGEYLVRAKYQRTGNPSSCDFESTGWLLSPDVLVVEADTTGVDPDSCETVFTGEAISCDSTREVVYTLVAGEDISDLKIQGGLTSGIVGDVTVDVQGADLEVTQRTPGNSSNRIIKLTGSVAACDSVTITVSWVSSKNAEIITGEWSASGAGSTLSVDGLECE